MKQAHPYEEPAYRFYKINEIDFWFHFKLLV